MTLSKNKCHKIHIGKEDRNCPDLEVHGDKMHEASSEKYLGDIFHKSGKNKENIASRIAKGYSRVNTILALITEAPLGWAKIKAGLRLRKAMLVNAILFNSECWHNFSEDDVKDFERVDQALLRGLANGHSKMSIPALYLELGQEPLRFVLATRRIMYLHTLVNRGDSEVTKKTYLAQKADPLKGDFCLLVEDDKKMLKLDKTDDEIKYMKKYQLKLILKKKVKEAALSYLQNEVKNKNLKKMKNLEYNSLKPMPYLTSPRFTQKKASLLMALRTRTVRGIRSDFGKMYPNKTCPLDGCTHLDTLDSLLTCPVLSGQVDTSISVEYEDVFSPDLEKQRAVTEVYARLLEIREEILSPPVA